MTNKEQELIEMQISLASKKVNWNDLGYWCGLAAARGSFYDRYKASKTV